MVWSIFHVFQLAPVTTAAVWVALVGVIGLSIRQILPWIKQSNDADAKFRDLLLRRVQRLEDRLERQERRHSAEQRHSNHKMRNVLSAFDSVLMALEVAPERVGEIVVMAKELRARHELAEAEELRGLYQDSLTEEPIEE